VSYTVEKIVNFGRSCAGSIAADVALRLSPIGLVTDETAA
jgi:hypothetical protein